MSLESVEYKFKCDNCGNIHINYKKELPHNWRIVWLNFSSGLKAKPHYAREMMVCWDCYASENNKMSLFKTLLRKLKEWP